MKVGVRALVSGHAAGPVTAISPLSFWGGIDVNTGVVIDRSNPAYGQSLAGTILIMTSGRGSSSSSSVLAEAIRLRSAPAGIVLAEPDAIIAVGALAAARLYGSVCPVVVMQKDDLVALSKAQSAIIETDSDGNASVSF